MNLPTMALDSEEAVLTHFLEGKESKGTNQEGWLRGTTSKKLGDAAGADDAAFCQYLRGSKVFEAKE